ncbi:BirA family transcriptional regulator, biotin operon repressor / biotin-[acetyl-CoA-carboxylase] ligase [Amphibacillus marinus]|uniref:Bifunctional ligase/repressor BirA n=1 Tax=Amphibacillus marinus TaxID=872970 RepID=A0A1H8GH86_9BACI|nr:biotin--[acetyl-CoA-carboxylase] ligase [Amphibacillus marinus]SEN43521.1 BirA family transcriptional regulator, biotin operon repressor / biotin-[acetyl-CoA-carboxylase] ligase [Amphibacillus marinus]
MSSTREKLIELLASQANTFVSGQWLSNQLQLSRTAVWKQIKQLEADGYRFQAVPNKGYRLIETPKKVSENTLFWGLSTKWLGKVIDHYEEISSTQIIASQHAQSGGQEGLVVVAEKQTAGKGRLNRAWDSNHHNGVWLSFILRPNLIPSHAPQLTLLTATVLARTIEKLTGVKPSIKWPNDILLNDRKIAGILTEMQAEQDAIHHVIIGIGININHKESDFDASIMKRATSLALETDKQYDKRVFIQTLLELFEGQYEAFLSHGFTPVKASWESYAYRFCDVVHYKAGKERAKGKIIGIASDGALMIEDALGNTKHLHSAEIDWF